MEINWLVIFFYFKRKILRNIRIKKIVDVIPEDQEKVKNSKKIFLRAVVSKDY